VLGDEASGSAYFFWRIQRRAYCAEDFTSRKATFPPLLNTRMS
jgi:hypothetical protein